MDQLSCFVTNKNTNLHLTRVFTMQEDNRSMLEAQLGKLVEVLPKLSNIDRFKFVNSPDLYASKLTIMA